MTTAQLQKRADKSQTLKCMRLKDGSFLVESSDGKIMYPVSLKEGEVSCTCADFQRGVKADPTMKCKHILAALDSNGEAEMAETAARKKPRLNPEFIKNLQGRDFVLFAGLLDLAHQKGLVKLDVEILQYPTPENGNEAVCRAVAETRHGDRFSDIGDASPKNTNKMIASHIVRMASTRAKARALRDLTNIGITCLDELGDIEDVVGADNGKGAKAVKPVKKEPVVKTPEPRKEAVTTPKPRTETAPKPESNEKPKETVSKLSEAQKRAMYNVGRRRGISQQELEDKVKTTFNVPVDDLTQAQASQMIRQLQTAA